MARLSPNEYNVLERAIEAGKRLSVYRRGTEYVVVASRLFLRDGKEAIEAVHPTTGEPMIFLIDDLDSVEVIR